MKVLNVPILIVFLVISGCVTQLAPSYDASLYNQITNANIKTMELFAVVSNGTNSSTFSQREERYNSLIGLYDALALQSSSRPIPDNKLLDQVNVQLGGRNLPLLTGDDIPSVGSLESISSQLKKMKDVDRDKGLKEGAIRAFVNGVKISMQQAVTYESFLER